MYFKENEFIENIEIYFLKDIAENKTIANYDNLKKSNDDINLLTLDLFEDIIAINFITNLHSDNIIFDTHNPKFNKAYFFDNCQKLKIFKEDNFIGEFSFLYVNSLNSKLKDLDKNNKKTDYQYDKRKSSNNKIKSTSKLKKINIFFHEYQNKDNISTKKMSLNLNRLSKSNSKEMPFLSPTNKSNKERSSSIFNSNFMLITLKNYHRRKSKDISKSLKNIFKFFNCIGYIIKLLIFLILSLIGFCIYYYFSQNILKGLIILNKNHLKFPTKLYTDEYGIIHIRSANYEDAFFTLGYAQARDRLWQIDFLRRFAKGKLSPILGIKALKIDKYMRNLGISFRAKHDLKTFLQIKEENFFSGNFHYENEDLKSLEILKQVEKFVDGINYYVKNNFLPLEYYIFNTKFKKFSLHDCFSISRLIGFLLTFDWHIEIFNQILSINQGKEFMEKFDLWNFRNFPFANETIVSYEEIEKLNLNIKDFDIGKIVNYKNFQIVFPFSKDKKNNETKSDIKEHSLNLENNNFLNLSFKESINYDTIELTKNDSSNINKSKFEESVINYSQSNSKLNSLKEKQELNSESIDINLQISHASNSWVIHGNRTESGKPIFTNDPHLNNRLPTLHYVAKMYIGKPESDFENIIVGSTFPGIPAVLFGNNKNISWGFTTDNRDTIDIVEEYVTRDYKYFIDSEGNISKTFSRKEKLKIKNEPKQYHKIYYTENGVLLDEYLKETSVFGIYYKHSHKNASKNFENNLEYLEKILENSVSEENNNKEKNFNKFNFTLLREYANQIDEIKINNITFIKALSLRFPAFDMELGAIRFYFDIMKAQSKEDFMDSLEAVTTPVLSFSWATVANEIGYTSIGKIPIKNFKESKIILKDMNLNVEDYHIKGFISREETPVIINPLKGYIVTANNEATPWNYKNFVNSYSYFNRFHRINQILEDKFKDEKFKFTIEDSKEMLSDVHDSYVEIILPKLVTILERNFEILEEKIKEIKETLHIIENNEKELELQKTDKKEIKINEKDENNKINYKDIRFDNEQIGDNIYNYEEKRKDDESLFLYFNQNKELIEKYKINKSKIIKYEKKILFINNIIIKLKNFDFKFYKDSQEASIYSIYEYLLGRNLLLKGERTLEKLVYEYKKNNEFIDENFNPFIPGFQDESEAHGVLNIMNYWNFIVNLVSEISQGKGIELESCKFYNYMEDYKDDFFKSFFSHINLKNSSTFPNGNDQKFKNKHFLNTNSSCEIYIATTLIYFLDFIKDKNYIDKDKKFLKWGELHYNNYPHEPFETVEFLKMIFSRKISTGGTRNTIKVSKNKFNDPKSPFVSTHSANFKYICDLSDITQPYILIDTGNSGNILSKFYDNFVEKSENNEFVKIQDHNFNDDFHLLFSFPEDNTLIFKNPT